MENGRQVEDGELLRRYAEECSETAFGEFVQRYLGLVYATALRRTGGDEHRAAEVAQQVFTTVARRAAGLARHDALTGWLYTATRNAALNLRRDEQRRRMREQEAGAMKELLGNSTPEADWNQLRPVLDEAMDELIGADREAVLLRFFEGRAFAEVGAKLRLSENAARMRVERALDKLRTQLGRRGIASTSAALGVVLANQAGAVAPAGLAASVTSAALVGAAGMGVAASVLVFMSTSKTVIGVAAILAVVGFGCAIYEGKTANETEMGLATLRQEHQTTLANVAALEARLRAAKQDAEAATEKVSVLQRELEVSKKTGTSLAARSAPTNGVSVIDTWSMPGYARLYVEKYRASLGLRYGPLYRILNLSPEQIAKFETTLTESQQGVVDIWVAASAQGLSTAANTPTGTAIARMTSAPEGNKEAKLKAMLGQSGFEQYQQFDKTSATREMVTSLAGNTYYSDIPLNAQQGEALVGILTSNSKTVRTPMADDGKKPVYLLTVVTDWDSVNAQAQAILSASQFAAFRSLAEQKRMDSEMRQILNPAHAPTGSKPVAGP